MDADTDTALTATLTGEPLDADDLYTAFTGWVADQGITLYPAQDEAILELVTGNNVVLATPTGSGKSLVAVAAHYFALARPRARCTPRRSRRWSARSSSRCAPCSARTTSG